MSLSAQYKALLDSDKDAISEEIMNDLGFTKPYSDKDIARAADLVIAVTSQSEYLERFVKKVSNGDAVLERKMIQDLIEEGLYEVTPETQFEELTEKVD